MPVLRSGARRGRANSNLNPVAAAVAQPRNRRGATARNRRGAAAVAAVVADERNPALNDEELNPKEEEIVLLEGGEDNNEEGVGERRMDDFDSGGKSADKVIGVEDESAAPLPEKVRFFFKKKLFFL